MAKQKHIVKENEVEKLLKMVQEDPDILSVMLFGSSVRQEQTRLSDKDICLVMVPRPKSYESLALSKKRLEYLKDFSLGIHIFQQLPLFVKRRVFKEGKILFVRDEDLLYELAFRTAQSFEDFKHIYYTYLQEVENTGSRTSTR